MRTFPSRVLAIVDEETLGHDVIAKAAAAARGGLRWLCLRARRLDTRERIRLGRALIDACPGASLMVHGDPRAAEALDAFGVHLPSRADASSVGARSRGAGFLWGVSCHARSELERALAVGADYARLSPFFAPVSKAAGGPPLGPGGFAEAICGLSLPVLALGGMTPETLPAAAGVGAAGVAVLGALFLAEDVEAQASLYREAAARCWVEGATPRSSSLT